MRLLPKTVATLITSTPDVTRVRDGLTSAIQPVLTFLNTFFQSAADGTLRVLTNLNAQGAVSVAGTTTLAGACSMSAGLAVTGLSNLTGSLRVNGSQTIYGGNNCLVIVPSVTSGALIYTTNPANTAALMQINADGSIVAQKYTSSNGFKSTIYMGKYWSSTAGMPTSYTIMLDWVTSGSTTAQMNCVYYAPFSGSVVGLTCHVNGGLSGYTASVALYKNGVATALTKTGTAGPLTATATKGIYTFNAGDALAVYIKGSSSAINQSFLAYLEVERDG